MLDDETKKLVVVWNEWHIWFMEYHAPK